MKVDQFVLHSRNKNAPFSLDSKKKPLFTALQLYFRGGKTVAQLMSFTKQRSFLKARGERNIENLRKTATGLPVSVKYKTCTNSSSLAPREQREEMKGISKRVRHNRSHDCRLRSQQHSFVL